MATPIRLKIDVTKIDKAHLFKGKKGIYLDAVIWPNRDGKDQYGNTHYVAQCVSKEAREAGTKGAIIGNAVFPDEAAPAQAPRPKAPANPVDAAPEDDSVQVPF